MSEPTKVSIGDDSGKVVLKFSRPTENLVMDPENARQIAEGIAKAAYTASTGINPNQKSSIISEQIRMRLITRTTHIIRNLQDKKTLPGRIAAEVVDTILSDVK